MNSGYQIVLDLTEAEYLALFRLGYRKLRSPKWQAQCLLRERLGLPDAISNELTIFNPAVPRHMA